MSNKQKRLEVLKSMLKVENSMRISDISKRLSVSPMTTRRDIEILENEGFINVLHGAVIYNTPENDNALSEYMLTVAESHNREKKKKIAHHALSYISNNDIIFIDAGSTTETLAKSLPEDINLTIICYAINIFLAVAARPNITTILLGGAYNRKTTILEQKGVSTILQKNRTKKAFISAGGFHSKLGVTCSNENECLTKITAVNQTAESFLLLDSSKFDEVNSYFFAEANAFNHIITDNGISESYRSFIDSMESKIHYI